MAKSHKTRQTGTASVPADCIAQSILFLRGQRVILDRELAAIYGVETRALNQAIKRNKDRFPENFMFQLDPEEVERSVIATSRSGSCLAASAQVRCQ
jgi:hypothetical protein